MQYCKCNLKPWHIHITSCMDVSIGVQFLVWAAPAQRRHCRRFNQNITWITCTTSRKQDQSLNRRTFAISWCCCRREYKSIRFFTIRIRICRCDKATNIRIRNVTLHRMRMQIFVIPLPRLQKSRAFVFHIVTRDSCVHFLCLSRTRSRLSKCPILNPTLRTLALMSIHHLIFLHDPNIPKGLIIISIMMTETKRHLQSIVLSRYWFRANQIRRPCKPVNGKSNPG